jgi:hypothetical protein
VRKTMTQRKGRISRGQLGRECSHHVALPAEALRGSARCTAMFQLARGLGGALPPYILERDGRDFRVFCFARAEAARAFHVRFGGEVLPVSPAG